MFFLNNMNISCALIFILFYFIFKRIEYFVFIDLIYFIVVMRGDNFCCILPVYCVSPFDYLLSIKLMSLEFVALFYFILQTCIVCCITIGPF